MQLEKRAGRGKISGSLRGILRKRRAQALPEWTGNQCICNREWDSSQKVSFKNSRTLWFTGTSVFFSVSRNAVSPRDLMPECVRQHGQSHTAALAVYIPLTGVEEHQLLRKHDTCGAEPPATVTWPIRIRHINSRVTCPCQT